MVSASIQISVEHLAEENKTEARGKIKCGFCKEKAAFVKSILCQ